MNAFKSVLSFCLLLIVIRRGNSLYTPLNEKSTCTNGTLVQYTNYFDCICDEGKIHVDQNLCADPVAKCEKLLDPCGEYSKCAHDVDGITLICKCSEGYEQKSATPLVCIPKGCSSFEGKCLGGMCVKKSDTEAQCGCFIGKEPSLDKTCVDSTKPTECKLTCPGGDKSACNILDEQFYECGCEEGFEMVENVCTEKYNGSAFPAYGILNIGLLLLISSIVYILV